MEDKKSHNSTMAQAICPDDIEYRVYDYQTVEGVIEDFASLRITIFKEYPYLYQGDMGAEKSYLKGFAQMKSLFLALAFHNGRVIGGINAYSVEESDAFVRDELAKITDNPADYVYFGEFLIYEEYRSLGIGRELMALTMKSVQEAGYGHICLCTVDREEDHPLRPRNYSSIHTYLLKNGYIRHEGLQAKLSWKEVDGIVKKQTMSFWTKALG